jgi:uncharacterized protein
VDQKGGHLTSTSTANDNPRTVTAFGSALLRVSPDSTTITAAITRLEKNPSDAFAKARRAAHSVTEFLRKAPIKESGLSRISLSQQFRLIDHQRQSVGYAARIGLKIILDQLDRTEEILSGLIRTGADEITSSEFHTSRLKELRAQARRLAMESAREKAGIYASVESLQAGEILEIEDVNPNVLQREFHVGGPAQIQRDLIDRVAEQDSLDPTAIQVGAAVMVTFELIRPASQLALLGGTVPKLKRTPRRRPIKKG